MIKITLALILAFLCPGFAETLSVVANGKSQEAKTTGKWTTIEAGLTSTGTKSLLSSKTPIAQGDFHLSATLQLSTLDGTAGESATLRIWNIHNRKTRHTFSEQSAPNYGQKRAALPSLGNAVKVAQMKTADHG